MGDVGRVLAAVAVGALAFEATADSAGTQPTPIDRHQLQNGLRVILAPDAVSVGVSMVVRYEVGMAHEPRDYRGMSHLLEHLTFRGSRHLAPLEGMKILQRWAPASTPRRSSRPPATLPKLRRP
jgi:hypothetical protein